MKRRLVIEDRSNLHVLDQSGHAHEREVGSVSVGSAAITYELNPESRIFPNTTLEAVRVDMDGTLLNPDMMRRFADWLKRKANELELDMEPEEQI